LGEYRKRKAHALVFYRSEYYDYGERILAIHTPVMPLATKEQLAAIDKALKRYDSKEIAKRTRLYLRKHDSVFLNEAFPKCQKSEIDAAVAILEKTGKYKLDVSANEKRLYIKKIPHYTPRWQKVLRDIGMAAVGAAFTLITGLIILQVDKKERLREIQQLENRLEQVENKLRSIK
jgi:hypothetical protein